MVASFPGRIPFALAAGLLVSSASAPPAGPEPGHVLLSWNDLGMHCMNESHEFISILPPYNNIYAQVIRRGSESELPEVVTDGITVTYHIPGNTYSVGKTDFWEWADELFGVTLPDDVGLTGKGLTGELDPGDGRFVAEGVPITPFPDATPDVEDPHG